MTYELKHIKYGIVKIGNRDNPENRNQDIKFSLTGTVKDHKIVIGESLWIANRDNWFRTSAVRSIYAVDSETGFDKLVIPSEMSAKDLDLPEPQAGDILLITQNSVYLLREGGGGISDNF